MYRTRKRDTYICMHGGEPQIERRIGPELHRAGEADARSLSQAGLISHQNCQYFCQYISNNIAKLRNTADTGR